MSHNKAYIGDAVYASYDGYQIELTTGDPEFHEMRIYLEPAVLRELIAFAQDIGMLEQKP